MGYSSAVNEWDIASSWFCSVCTLPQHARSCQVTTAVVVVVMYHHRAGAAGGIGSRIIWTVLCESNPNATTTTRRNSSLSRVQNISLFQLLSWRLDHFHITYFIFLPRFLRLYTYKVSTVPPKTTMISLKMAGLWKKIQSSRNWKFDSN
jgi:hypothetical protein